jgi:uncharacterized protein YoxC
LIAAKVLGFTHLALAQTALGSETVVVVGRAGGWQRWVEVLADIATIFIAVALISIAIALIAAALQSRRLLGKVHVLMERLHTDLGMIIKHATEVSGTVAYMSAAVRTDVDRVRSSIESAQERVTAAADIAEHRIRRFDALLEMVQTEAEELFIETASTLRGVHAGARSLRGEYDDLEWESEMEDRMVEPEEQARRNTP